MTGKALGAAAIKAFEGRGISTETAAKFGIYTGRSVRLDDGKGGTRTDVVPDAAGNIVVFPFYDRGVVAAEKYRAPGKRFWQRDGGRRTFYNADVLDDTALEQGAYPAIITEGEIDCITSVDCGFPHTVSVPDGAPDVKPGEDPEQLQPIDPNREQEGKFEFLFNNRERLKRIKRFIIAVDGDRPGKRLAAELVRRLSASRCMFITYPPEPVIDTDKLEEWPAGKRPCKDLNEVRMHFGAEAVTSVLTAAKPYPVRGLYRLSEYPDLEPLRTYSTGWSTVDQHLRMFPGEFMVVTGIPGHGKTRWVLNLIVNLADLHGWRSAIFSPEMPTVPHLRDVLRKIHLHRPPFDLDRAEIARADQWIDRNLVFIDADPTGHGVEDQDFDLEWILDRATDAVLRDGIRILVIDPWNEVEHARRRDETMTDYIGRAIRMLKRFARLYEVAVIVVAHPTKEVGRDGKSRPPTLYDIEGSAHWFNKPDHGVVVDRPNSDENVSEIRFAKVRFEESGRKGKVRMRFNETSSRYELLAHMEPIQ